MATARRSRLPRSPENDLRLLINYCRRLEKITDRLTVPEIEEMSESDQDILYWWTSRLGAALGGCADVVVHNDPDGMADRRG